MTLGRSAGTTLLLGLGLAACSSVYSSKGAETLPVAQIGILEHHDPVGSGVVIEDVDGHWRGLGTKTIYRLTPGVHSFAAKANIPLHVSGSLVRWLDVRAGRVYSIHTAIDTHAKTWQFWIIDDATGDRVDFAR